MGKWTKEEISRVEYNERGSHVCVQKNETILKV